jgi:hypothetical protein
MHWSDGGQLLEITPKRQTINNKQKMGNVSV